MIPSYSLEALMRHGFINVAGIEVEEAISRFSSDEASFVRLFDSRGSKSHLMTAPDVVGERFYLGHSLPRNRTGKEGQTSHSSIRSALPILGQSAISCAEEHLSENSFHSL